MGEPPIKRAESEQSMSLPYPHDRARARKEDGEQPFKDVRESLGEAELPRDASSRDGYTTTESDEERHARQEAEAGERLRDIGDEFSEDH
jgi:hypothetical protein